MHLRGGHPELEGVCAIHVVAEFAPGVKCVREMFFEDSPRVNFTAFGLIIADGVKPWDATAVGLVHRF